MQYAIDYYSFVVGFQIRSCESFSIFFFWYTFWPSWVTCIAV